MSLSLVASFSLGIIIVIIICVHLDSRKEIISRSSIERHRDRERANAREMRSDAHTHVWIHELKISLIWIKCTLSHCRLLLLWRQRVRDIGSFTFPRWMVWVPLTRVRFSKIFYFVWVFFSSSFFICSSSVSLLGWSSHQTSFDVFESKMIVCTLVTFG